MDSIEIFFYSHITLYGEQAFIKRLWSHPFHRKLFCVFWTVYIFIDLAHQSKVWHFNSIITANKDITSCKVSMNKIVFGKMVLMITCKKVGIIERWIITDQITWTWHQDKQMCYLKLSYTDNAYCPHNFALLKIAGKFWANILTQKESLMFQYLGSEFDSTKYLNLSSWVSLSRKLSQVKYIYLGNLIFRNYGKLDLSYIIYIK